MNYIRSLFELLRELVERNVNITEYTQTVSQQVKYTK